MDPIRYFRTSPLPLLLCSILIFFLLPGSSKGSTPPTGGSCVQCHKVKLGANHQLSCTTCHQGNDRETAKVAAHASLIAHPAGPNHMNDSCGRCHSREVAELPKSLHATLKKAVNLVRQAFGATKPLPGLTAIPVQPDPQNVLQLADDMLRRRCLRCHLYSNGDEYPATHHGTGCAACHLDYRDGRLKSHRFNAHPSDQVCLSCHYGNLVGSDYYGRAEHDFDVDYRTPYSAGGPPARPYGIEYHRLVPDIHRQRGLACIDCHGRKELMAPGDSSTRPSCAGCHDAKLLRRRLPARVVRGKSGFSLISASGTRHPLPLMLDPAHDGTGARIDCQVCHGQWSYNDTTTHLLRSDIDDSDQWSRLTVQGSSEVEQLLENNLNPNRDEEPPASTDTITGEKRPGIWYKGYTMRRWGHPLLGRASDGRITVVRPILKLKLSWIDVNDQVRFDSSASSAPDGGMVPYVPHTTGAAGLFYQQRIRDFLQKERTRTEKSGNK